LIFPVLLGAAFGRPGAGLVWGVLLRLVVVHHATFLTNSAAHTFGARKHSAQTSARDSWWLPLFSFGEGYHNYHHAYPSDYRNGVAWHHWDPTKWVIRALSLPGWTHSLRGNSRTET
jgi:stearoyl-CoA desaturase (delta-9 desaturase)